ncbi:MAG TPA: tRNA lysidine(34) synthetase TilS [Acidimicrobiales bacterium]|nr:tRNA lysidine(34) synthetase TilS [Acidimicrobiales bacterium]
MVRAPLTGDERAASTPEGATNGGFRWQKRPISGLPRRMITESAGDLLARCTFPPAGAPLVCAVSGGADSLALMVLAVAAGCEVTAVHVDHGLRAESAGEGGVVAAAASRYGVAFRSVQVELAAGGNLEARARAARRAALPAGAATGHTADDQAETILLNLLRGAGLDGLAGIRPGPTKPLLALRRFETHALCSAEGLVPVQDPSNSDPAFRRNRVRHELLPLLDEIAERDVVPVLVRQAALLRDEADLLDDLSAGIDSGDAGALAAAPAALARRALRALLSDGEHPPSSAAMERVMAVARGEFTACELEGGRRVSRSRGRLRVERAE